MSPLMRSHQLNTEGPMMSYTSLRSQLKSVFRDILFSYVGEYCVSLRQIEKFDFES